jgi:hypothetical protein
MATDRGGRQMGGRVLMVLLVLTGAGYGQHLADVPVSTGTSVTLAVFGAEVVADGVTTRVLYQRHYGETDPLAKPFVRAGVPGQIGASLLGAGATGSVWFVLHRTHHEATARWFLRSVNAGEGCNVARQFAILRTSRK